MGKWIRRSCAASMTLAAFAFASQAGAAQTIGETEDQGSGGVYCDYGGTYIQTASAGGRYAAPFDGVITAWQSAGKWQPALTFKVARLGPGSNYTVIASDGPREYTVETYTTQSYPVRMPVRQGDVIGAHIPVANRVCFWDDGGTETWGHDPANTPTGSTGFFDSTGVNNVPVQATIERDRDNDGYGDETQDGCPTNAATHGPCPLPTVLGETFTPITTACSTTVIPQLPADVRYAAPHDGVITSWSHQANSIVGGTLKFKVLRPLGGSNYLAVGDSDVKTPVANQLNTYATRIPVRQGDWIGLRAQGVACTSNVSASGSSLFSTADVAPGASASFNPSNRRIDLSASLEADADGDGYGDTTQDKCPSDASTQGTCPVKPPPVDAACEKARAALAKAKSKLAKLRKNDASAKKVKKARKAVKKAKGRVRKEC